MYNVVLAAVCIVLLVLVLFCAIPGTEYFTNEHPLDAHISKLLSCSKTDTCPKINKALNINSKYGLNIRTISGKIGHIIHRRNVKAPHLSGPVQQATIGAEAYNYDVGSTRYHLALMYTMFKALNEEKSNYDDATALHITELKRMFERLGQCPCS